VAIIEKLLYLDTARIGRITPGAQIAFIDYLALVGQEGGSSYFERFLRHGLADCPTWMNAAYPNLNCWNGIASLKHSLRTLAGSRPELPMLLSLRTSQLMKLAARLMVRNCSNVLTTDLGWPSYYITLEAERARSNATTTTVLVKNAVLERGATEDEVVETICRAYADNRCDGLFLSAVSNLGVRLPIARIVRKLESAHEVRFDVVDGAQDFCHLTPDIHEEYCDFNCRSSIMALDSRCSTTQTSRMSSTMARRVANSSGALGRPMRIRRGSKSFPKSCVKRPFKRRAKGDLKKSWGNKNQSAEGASLGA